MKTIKLNNGVEMPMVGFGVFQVPDLAVCQKAVEDAISVGYRLIDTAAAYKNEEAVGAAIRASGIPRSDFFVTTKLWTQDHGYDNTLRAFDTSMKKLGLDQLDLWLIHKPYGDVYGAWRAMERLYKEGRIRAIGVTSFPDDRLLDLFLHNEVKPAVNQIETHVFQQQKLAREYLKKYGCQIESWGPFAEGRKDMFTNPVLTAIGAKYGKTAAQTALRFLLQSDVVIIPKSVHKERMQQNFVLFDFTLSAEDMAAIEALDGGESLFFSHYDPKTVEWFMSIL